MRSYPRIVAITGGIGSGKSMVSRVLVCMGYPVYDCDSRAKVLMDTDERLKQRLVDEIHPDAVRGGAIDRKVVSAAVFGNERLLVRLNGMVHSSVRDDFSRWCDSHADKRSTDSVFVECAILYSSGFDRMVDEVWTVTAPEQLRVERVMKRNGLSADDVRRRLAAQQTELSGHHRCMHEVINDDFHALLPQINALLTELKG